MLRPSHHPTDTPPRRKPSRLWRPRPRHDLLPTLRVARAIMNDLKDGLSGPGARRAARRLRRLLNTPGLGLADLSGNLVWSGHSPDSDAVATLVDHVLRGETAKDLPPLTAALREAASWVADAVERGRLEASADRAEQAELRALRAEISPHFVYNALTVIASLMRSDPDQASELMLDFADYTRYSLARRGDYTTVSDEFHAIETYLALQRAVLGDRLRVQVRVAPEVLGVAIPYLVLQPLVENAVSHGIEPRAGAGLIQVTGEAEGNECVISIEDDGVGMDPERAREILAGRGGSDSVGLANVDRRLRHVYGPWYGLVVETAVDAGTRVIVRVPRFQPGVMP